MGETLFNAAARELWEETGVRADPLRVLTAVDAFDGARRPPVRHFVLVGVLCRWRSGHPVPGDDALEAAWVDRRALSDHGLACSLDVREVAELAFAAVEGPAS